MVIVTPIPTKQKHTLSWLLCFESWFEDATQLFE